MKCVACNADVLYPDRQDGKCNKCGHRFAFEPQPVRVRKQLVVRIEFGGVFALSRGLLIRRGQEHQPVEALQLPTA